MLVASDGTQDSTPTEASGERVSSMWLRTHGPKYHPEL
jgi:hypothetical protein